MSDSQRVRNFDLINPVMHRGSMMSQIVEANGDKLELTGDCNFVKVTPNPSTKRDAFLVPLTNVKKLTPVDEAAEAAVAAAKEAEQKAKAKHEAKHNPQPKSALKGVEKFVKDENGRISTVLV